MADVCQTGKVVALTQLEDNRVFLMVKAGAQTGDLNAPLAHEQMVPIKTHWDELEDCVVLRLLFNSCSQFEGVEDEIPNDTGHLYVISAKGDRRDAIEEAGTALPRLRRSRLLSTRTAPLNLRSERLPSGGCSSVVRQATSWNSRRSTARWVTGCRLWLRWCWLTDKAMSISCAVPRAISRPNAVTLRFCPGGKGRLYQEGNPVPRAADS